MHSIIYVLLQLVVPSCTRNQHRKEVVVVQLQAKWFFV